MQRLRDAAVLDMRAYISLLCTPYRICPESLTNSRTRRYRAACTTSLESRGRSGKFRQALPLTALNKRQRILGSISASTFPNHHHIPFLICRPLASDILFVTLWQLVLPPASCLLPRQPRRRTLTVASRYLRHPPGCQQPGRCESSPALRSEYPY